MHEQHSHQDKIMSFNVVLVAVFFIHIKFHDKAVVLKIRAIPHLFERLFLRSWENNRDCHITMPLSLKTMEVQIKGDQ